MGFINKGYKKILVMAALACCGCEGFLPIGTEQIDLPSVQTIEQLNEKANNILIARCNSCHGSESTALGGINYIHNATALIANEWIVPGSAGESRLFESIVNGSMPPNQTMAPDEIDTIREWIRNGAQSPTPANMDNEPRTYQAMLQLISNDINEMVDAGIDTRNQRYFILSHFDTQNISLAQIKQNQLAITKLVNSLSWEAGLATPVRVQNSQLILRYDISRLGWNQAKWQAIEELYPYSLDVTPARPALLTENLLTQLNTIKTATGTTIPIVRGDWFAHAGANPGLYHELLEIPENILDLETRLGINVINNINTQNIVRAGFQNSNVSTSNRLMERHETQFGSYWKSYDFANNTSISNIFLFPVGPNLSSLQFTETERFVHAGGEIIFNLPNGLQAYALTDSSDNRIDEAPITIVQDPQRPSKVVTNGISCISCHAQGMNRNYDDVRNFVIANAANFSALTVTAVTATHANDTLLNSLFDEDDERFQSAMRTLAGNAVYGEPVGPAYYTYASRMNLTQTARELEISDTQLRAAIELSPELRLILGELLLVDGRITREFFEQNFYNIYRLTHLP